MIQTNDLPHILDEFGDKTLSIYLHIDPGAQENQATRPAWSIWLKNNLRKIEKEIIAPEDEGWESITSRLESFFSAYKPDGKTLVMWIDDENQTILELPIAMQNQAVFGEPVLAPMLRVMDEYKHYLIVLVDKEKAIIRSAYLGNFETEAEMTIDLDYDWGERTLMPHGAGDAVASRGGNNREAFEDMIHAHIQRFYKDVAKAVQDELESTETIRIILGGDERSAHEIHNYLHDSIKDEVVAILPIPVNAKIDEIAEKIWQTAYNYECDFEFDLVNEVINQAKSDGRGVLGREDLAQAMLMQQVESFIVPSSLFQTDPFYVQELTNWAIEHNKSIEFVHSQAARNLEAEGEVAAKLYYQIKSPSE